MKKLFASLVIAATIAMPLAASAATMRTSDHYTLAPKETVNDDLYFASGNATLDGNVNGDVFGAGGHITVNGNVAQDAVVVGGQLAVRGNVADDLRVAGGQVELSGKVGDDLFVSGGKVYITSDAKIGGNVYVAGGQVVIDGIVTGDVYGASGDLQINGTIHGHVKLAGDKVFVGRTAVLDKGLWYRSGHEAEVQAGAQIVGPIQFVNSKPQMPRNKEMGEVFFAIVKILVVLKFLMLVAMALVLVLVFPTIPATISERTLGQFWHTVLVGFVVAVMVPICCILLGITLVGLPIAIIMGLVYIIWMILAKVFGAIMLGALIHQLITKVAAPAVNWKTALVGVVAWCILGVVPVIGWIACSIFGLAGFGGIALYWHRTVWKNR
jgi:cytoskeletal protein CcmA (bactofilin family)